MEFTEKILAPREVYHQPYAGLGNLDLESIYLDFTWSSLFSEQGLS